MKEDTTNLKEVKTEGKTIKSEVMKGNIKMRFGEFKGKSIDTVPDRRLKWYIEKGLLKGRALIYAKTKIKFPKDDWIVTVEDSVNDKDGEYEVLAYTSKQAINECQRLNKIRCSQSFHGTTFSAIKKKDRL